MNIAQSRGQSQNVILVLWVRIKTCDVHRLFMKYPELSIPMCSWDLTTCGVITWTFAHSGTPLVMRNPWHRWAFPAGFRLDPSTQAGCPSDFGAWSLYCHRPYKIRLCISHVVNWTFKMIYRVRFATMTMIRIYYTNPSIIYLFALMVLSIVWIYWLAIRMGYYKKKNLLLIVHHLLP